MMVGVVVVFCLYRPYEYHCRDEPLCSLCGELELEFDLRVRDN